MANKSVELDWRVNTAGLLKEIFSNPGTGMLKIPITVFANILAEVATRASELNDPELNKLMAQLALYEVTDPYSLDYDEKVTHALLEGKAKEN